MKTITTVTTTTDIINDNIYFPMSYFIGNKHVCNRHLGGNMKMIYDYTKHIHDVCEFIHLNKIMIKDEYRIYILETIVWTEDKISIYLKRYEHDYTHQRV